MPYFDQLTYTLSGYRRNDDIESMRKVAKRAVSIVERDPDVPQAKETLEKGSIEELLIIADYNTAYHTHARFIAPHVMREIKTKPHLIRVVSCMAAFCFGKDLDVVNHYIQEFDRRQDDGLKDVKVLMVYKDIKAENYRHKREMDKLRERLWAAQNPEVAREKEAEAKRKEEELLKLVKEKEEQRKKEKEAAEAKRLEAIEQKRQAQKRLQKERAEIRNAFLNQFGRLSLDDQLLTMAKDENHNPSYYGIDFDSITDEDIVTLPQQTIEAIINAYSSYSDKKWKAFQRRLKRHMSNNVPTE